MAQDLFAAGVDNWTKVAAIAAVVAAATGILGVIVGVIDVVLTRRTAKAGERQAMRLRPHPRALFRSAEAGAGSEIKVELSRYPELDLDGLVREQGDTARGTVPNPDPSSVSPVFGTLAALSGPYLPITAQDRVDFAGSVDKFEGDLRAWLERLRGAWAAEESNVHLSFRLVNDGGAPADGLTLFVELPDGLEFVESRPEIGPLPSRPKFRRRRRFPDFGLDPSLFRSPPVASLIPSVPSLTSGGPVYDEERRRVRYWMTKLQHNVPDDSLESTTLSVGGPGRYQVNWEIHAENLPSPARGTLTVEVLPASAGTRVIRNWSAMPAQPSAN